MAKKIYHGLRFEVGRVRVSVKDLDRNVTYDLDPAPSQNLWNHSPDGFEWGYSGSGPAQLALAILLDHFEETENARRGRFKGLDQATHYHALRHYQHFKFRVIGRLNTHKWQLSTGEIDWVLKDLNECPTC